MFDHIASVPPTDLVVAKDAAFITQYCYEHISAYLLTEPTSPSVGRIWQDGKRICWIEEDPDSNPENPSFVLRKKVPFHIVPSMTEISFIRRELGVDSTTIIINQDIGNIPMLRIEPVLSESQPDERVEILVSISIRIPNTGLTSVLDTVRPVIDIAAQVKGASTSISIQPYNPDAEDE